MIGYTNELLVKALDQRQLDLPLTAEDKQRFLTYLVAQGYLDSSDRRYKAFAIRGPGTPHDFAALLRSGFSQRMRSVPATTGTTASPMFQPVGGMNASRVSCSGSAGVPISMPSIVRNHVSSLTH